LGGTGAVAGVQKDGVALFAEDLGGFLAEAVGAAGYEDAGHLGFAVVLCCFFF
jgi:hypothetical protein